MSLLNLDITNPTQQFERKLRRLIAYTAKRDGTLEVPDRPYYIYVRFGSLTGPEGVVYDARRAAPRMNGVAIQLVERVLAPGEFEVERVADSATPSIINMQYSPRRLEYGGPDPVIIDHRQIKQGLLNQTNPPSMVVHVGEFGYDEWDGSKFVDHTVAAQDTGTITAPAAGLARWDAISWDTADELLNVTTGTPFSKLLPEAGDKPAYPDGDRPLGYIRLDDATTALQNGVNIYPKPPYFTFGGGLAGSADASAVTYTPATLGNWPSGADPGNTDDALDILAYEYNILVHRFPGANLVVVDSSQNTAGAGTYLVNTSTSALTVTLDTGDAVGTDGTQIIIKDRSGNASAQNITIDTEGAETIEGDASLTISTDYGMLWVVSYDGNWLRLN